VAASRTTVTGWDRVVRTREAGRRRQAALDALGSPVSVGSGIFELEQMLHTVEPGSRTRLTANYAGCRAVVMTHPRVRAIVERLAQEKRPITASERRVLRNAIAEARTMGAAAQLEAWGAGSGEILSPAGRRILDYLNNALNETMPFDSLVSLITTAVEQPDTAW
jgi:hypothetical protein